MTLFAEKVLKVVQKIKPGTTLTYGEVAKLAGNPGAGRAVGRILNTYDAKRIKVPCHRVIGKNGDLTGFRWGIAKKKKLLEKEGVWLPLHKLHDSQS